MLFSFDIVVIKEAINRDEQHDLQMIHRSITSIGRYSHAIWSE